MLITYTIPPSLRETQEEYTLARLYSAARHLRAGHPAHQYVDSQGRVTNLVNLWNTLSGLGVYLAYQSAMWDIHNRWRSEHGGRPEDHETIPKYRHFVSLTAASALANVIHRKYATFFAARFPSLMDPLGRLPYSLGTSDFCMAVIYDCVQGIEYRRFALPNGFIFNWSVMTSDVLSTIYRDTQQEIVRRWTDDELRVRIYRDLDRAVSNLLVEKVYEVMNRRATATGGIDLADSPHQEVLQPSQGSSGGPRGGSPAYVPDHYDPTIDMSPG